MRARALACLLAGLVLGSCAAHSVPPERAGASSPLVDVRVLRDGDRWTADYRFGMTAPAWAFHRSAAAQAGRSWRRQSWRILTPGVRLERRRWYDVLVAEDGSVPRQVRIAFEPFTGDLETSYDPALRFSDGSVALYSEQFSAFPLSALTMADTLPIDLNEVAEDDVQTRVTFRDRSGEVLQAGRRHRARTLVSGDTYVLYGDAQPVENEIISTVIDPALPAWLRKSLTASTLRVLDHYAERLGPRSGEKPMLMVSWTGPTAGKTSMGGSVLPGLILMTFEGEGVLTENRTARDHAGWFIGHEAAHFWLGEEVGYDGPRDAWITEGGADLLAIRAFAALDPAYDARAKLQALLDECVALAAGRPIASAMERGEHRAYYACGAMFGLVAEAAAMRRGGDFFSYWRGLIEANRADGTVSADEWLDALARNSGDAALAEGIGRMVTRGVADPGAHLAALFTRAGIPHSRDRTGRLLLE